MALEDDAVYGFNKGDSEELLRLIGDRGVTEVKTKASLDFDKLLVVMTPSGGIAARSGTTCGTADCTVQVVTYDGAITATTRTIKVCNLSEDAVGGSAYIMCHKVPGGAYVAHWEDCPSA